jgi:chromosome segregation ATPase
MLNKIKNSISKKKVRHQRVELRNLHSKLQQLNDLLAKDDVDLSELKDIQTNNQQLISENKKEVDASQLALKQNKKDIKNIQKQTKKYQAVLYKLVDEIEAKHKDIESLEQDLYKKQRLFGEAKSSFNMKDQENAHVTGIFNSIRQEVSAVENEILSLNESIEKMRGLKESTIEDIRLLESQKEECFKIRSSKEDKNILLKEQYNKFLKKKQDLEKHIDFLVNIDDGAEGQFKDEFSKLNELKTTVRLLVKQESELEDGLDELNQKSTSLKSQVNHFEKEIELKQHQVLELSRVLEINGQENTRLSEREIDASAKLKGLDLEVINQNRKLEESKKDHHELCLQIKNRELEIEALTQKRDELAKYHKLTNIELSEFDKKNTYLSNKIQRVRSELAAQESEVSERRDKLNTLKDTLKLISDTSTTKDEVIDKWHLELSELNSNISEVTSDIELVKVELEVKDNQINELEVKSSVAKGEQESLVQELASKNGQLNIMNLKSTCIENKVHEISTSVDNKIAHLNIVSQKIAAKELQLLELDENLLSETKKELDYEHKIERAQKDRDCVQVEFDSKEKELTGLQDKNSVNKNELRDLTALKIKLISKKTNIDSSIKQSFEDYKTCEFEISQGHRNIKSIGEAIDSSKSQLELAVLQVKRLSEKKARQEKHIYELTANKDRVEKQLREVNLTFNTAHNEYSKYLSIIEDGQKSLEALTAQKSNLITKIELYQSEKNNLLQSISEIKNQTEQVREINNKLLTEINEKEDFLLSHSKIHEELDKEFKILKHKNNGLKAAVTKIDSSLERTRTQIQETKQNTKVLKSNIGELQSQAKDFRLQVQGIEREKRSSIIKKHQVESEFGDVQKMYHSLKEIYDDKKSAVDSLKEEIKKKVGVVTKSTNLMPKLEKMVSGLSGQQLFLLRSSESLDAIKGHRKDLEGNLEQFRNKLNLFSKEINDFYFEVETTEVVDAQLNTSADKALAKKYLDLVFSATKKREKVNGQEMVELLEKLEDKVDSHIASINQSFDHFELGSEVVNKSESEFVALKETFEEALDKYNVSSKKFEMFNVKVRDLIATTNASDIVVNKEFFLTALYSKTRELGIGLEIDENVEDSITQKEFRILYQSIRLYSEVIRELNSGKLRLKLFRIKNFGDGHVVLRYDELNDFDIITLKNTFPIINNELKANFEKTPLKLAYKGHVNDAGKFSKLDIIVKHGDSKKVVSDKKVHLVRSRTGQTRKQF